MNTDNETLMGFPVVYKFKQVVILDASKDAEFGFYYKFVLFDKKFRFSNGVCRSIR